MNDDDDKTVVDSSRAPRMQDGNALPVGTRLGEFEITGLIGEGGFGIVYLAYDHTLDRQVALKEYMPSGLASRTQAMRVAVRSRNYVDTFTAGLKSFVNEARLLARFDSPALVKVHRFFEGNGTAYMVMPFYEGITLKQALEEKRVKPDEEWIRALLANLLDAIETIHQAQCYHRDIAPDNILLLAEGRPLLLDFGAARRVIGDLTQGLTVILKPGFAPIEQYADMPGMRQGPWTDIYALAAVIYYLITGKSPSPSVVRIVHDDMVPAREAGRGRYSDGFLNTIDRALAVRPEQRIQSVDELRRALALEDAVPHTMPGPVAVSDQAELLRAKAENDSRLSPEAAAAAGRPADAVKKDGRPLLALSALLLCVGIGIALAGYHWLSEPEPSTSAAAGSGMPAAPAESAGAGAGSAGDGGNAGYDAAPPAAGAPTAGPPAGGTPNASDPAPAIQQAQPAGTPGVEGNAMPPLAAVPQSSKPATDDRTAVDSTARQPAVPPPQPAVSAEEELWREVSRQNDPIAYQAYLNEYPRGKHATAAKLRRDRLQEKMAAAPPTTSERNAGKAGNPESALSGNVQAAPTSVTPTTQASASTAPAANASAGASSAGRTDAGSEPTPPIAMKTPEPQQKTEPPKIDPPKTEASGKDPIPAPAPLGAPAAGQKTLKFPGQTMTGNFTSDPATGVVSGTGQIRWDNGDAFEGKLVKGKKEGKGKFIWANGQQYNGDWSGDLPNGRGVFYFPDGSRYQGEVKNGEMHGHGRYIWPSGTYWEGEYRNGEQPENGETVSAGAR